MHDVRVWEGLAMTDRYTVFKKTFPAKWNKQKGLKLKAHHAETKRGEEKERYGNKSIWKRLQSHFWASGTDHSESHYLQMEKTWTCGESSQKLLASNRTLTSHLGNPSRTQKNIYRIAGHARVMLLDPSVETGWKIRSVVRWKQSEEHETSSHIGPNTSPCKAFQKPGQCHIWFHRFPQ